MNAEPRGSEVQGQAMTPSPSLWTRLATGNKKGMRVGGGNAQALRGNDEAGRGITIHSSGRLRRR